MANKKQTFEELEQHLKEAHQLIAALRGGEIDSVDAIVTKLDVTLLRAGKLEVELYQSERNFRNSINESPLGVLIINTEGIPLYINQSALDIFGYGSIDDFHAKPIGSIIAEQSYSQYLERREKRLKGESDLSHYEFQIVRPDGSIRHLEAFQKWITWDGQKQFQVLLNDIAEQKRAEVLLRDSEQRYRLLIDNANESIVVVQDGLIKFVNPMTLVLSGRDSEQELIDRPFSEFIHPDDRGMVVENYRRRINNEAVQPRYDFRVVTLDGIVKWAEITAAFIEWQGKSATLNFLTDITARKQAEKEIVHLASFPEMNPNIVLELDNEGNIKYLNPVAKSVFPDLTTLRVNHAFLIDWVQVVKELQRSTLNKILNRVVVVDRSSYQQIISKVAENQIRVYGQDITEHRRMENDVLNSEEKYRSLVNNIKLGIYRSTPGATGRFLEVNQAMEEITGYSREKLLGINVSDLYLHPEERAIVSGEVTGTPGKVSREIYMRKKDGTPIVVLITAMAVRDTTSQVQHIDGMMEDITARKHMQEQLMAQDRLASIGQLVSGVAHEINNPLTGVIGFSELLLQRDLPDDVKADLKVINSEAMRTAEIVKNLLTFARQQPEGKTEVDINDILQKVLTLRAHEQKVHNIEVITHLAADLPRINGNSSQLQQVFFNIVINAEFFMIDTHHKGNLTVTTERIENVIRTSITDDGPGISAQHLNNLFTPFFTTKAVGKGTGLGLSIGYGIITEHGGTIHAESEPGKGATFIVELPISKAGTSGEAAE